MIEQAAQMLARLLRLRVTNNVAAEVVGREASTQWLGLETAQLQAMTDEEISEHLRRTGPLPEFAVRLGVAIRLLQLESERLTQAGEVGPAQELRATAACLLLRAHILGVAPELPEFAPKLGELLESIRVGELPARVGVLLMCHHEHSGQFGAAEDVLFELRDTLGYSDWLGELGESFYARLRLHPQAALTVGNLPSEEVGQGAEEWRSWAASQRATHR